MDWKVARKCDLNVRIKFFAMGQKHTIRSVQARVCVPCSLEHLDTIQVTRSTHSCCRRSKVIACFTFSGDGWQALGEGTLCNRSAQAAAVRLASLENKDPFTRVKVRGLAKGTTLLKARLSLGDLLAGLQVGGDDNTSTLDFTVLRAGSVPGCCEEPFLLVLENGRESSNAAHGSLKEATGVSSEDDGATLLTPGLHSQDHHHDDDDQDHYYHDADDDNDHYHDADDYDDYYDAHDDDDHHYYADDDNIDYHNDADNDNDDDYHDADDNDDDYHDADDNDNYYDADDNDDDYHDADDNDNYYDADDNDDYHDAVNNDNYHDANDDDDDYHDADNNDNYHDANDNDDDYHDVDDNDDYHDVDDNDDYHDANDNDDDYHDAEDYYGAINDNNEDDDKVAHTLEDIKVIVQHNVINLQDECRTDMIKNSLDRLTEDGLAEVSPPPTPDWSTPVWPELGTADPRFDKKVHQDAPRRDGLRKRLGYYAGWLAMGLMFYNAWLQFCSEPKH